LYNWQSLFCQGIEERETNTLTISAGDDGIVSLDITENKTREAMLLLCAPVCVIHNEAASSHPAASSVFLFFSLSVLWLGQLSFGSVGVGAVTLHPPQKIRLPMKYIKKRKEKKERRRRRSAR
jgi:hypothetical protein